MKRLVGLIEEKLRKASVKTRPARVTTDNYVAVDSEIMIRLGLADLRTLLSRKEVIVRAHESDRQKGKYASYTVRMTYGGKGVPKNVNV